MLADLIEKGFKNKLKRKSRGIKQASLWVMHNTYMPSVLIETGFITNKKEGAYLNSKNGQTKIANAIKDAIIDYKREIDQNVGSSIRSGDQDIEIEITDEPMILEGISFKIQISASSKKLDPKSYNFKGLPEISRIKSGNIYKYFSGSTSDYTKAKEFQKEAKYKGYSDAFIVAYKDGNKIDVSDALKSASN